MIKSPLALFFALCFTITSIWTVSAGIRDVFLSPPNAHHILSVPFMLAIFTVVVAILLYRTAFGLDSNSQDNATSIC
ncbi:MAG: hypothetical protein J6M18_04680 [Actinomycetaceae bacterium]|nr:hypothetical protein [Actinomycetaceae bacterium]